MSNFINTSALIGDDALCAAIIQQTVTEIRDDALTYLSAHPLAGCTTLSLIDFPAVTSIVSGSLKGCTALTVLILRGETVCSLTNTNALTGSAIASGTGYIYVPGALVDSYKTATNWSTYATQFRALEDYTVDGTTTGELDETKI